MHHNLGFDRLDCCTNLLIQSQRAIARNNLRLRIWRIKDLHLGQLVTLGNQCLYGHGDLPAALSELMIKPSATCHEQQLGVARKRLRQHEPSQSNWHVRISAPEELA